MRANAQSKFACPPNLQAGPRKRSVGVRPALPHSPGSPVSPDCPYTLLILINGCTVFSHSLVLFPILSSLFFPHAWLSLCSLLVLKLHHPAFQLEVGFVKFFYVFLKFAVFFPPNVSVANAHFYPVLTIFFLPLSIADLSPRAPPNSKGFFFVLFSCRL